MEDNSNPASPEPPTLLQQPVTKQPQLPVPQNPIPQPQQVPQGIQKMIDKAILRGKIQGFGAKDIEKAKAYQLHFEQTSHRVRTSGKNKKIGGIRRKISATYTPR